jgi:4-hydroxy-2-oxoglutarate aldolase
MSFATVFPPMATPFTPDGAVDAAGIHKNVRLLSSTALGGIVALGSNGEAPLLDEAESDLVIGETRQSLDRGVLIAGTGRESTPATIAASVRAAKLGADAVLVRTPSYFKGRMTTDALGRHYCAVAYACPVPVLLYNYPAVTGVNLGADAIARLSEHPNIVGVKETGSDTGQVAAYVAAARPGFAVIAGSAPTFYPSLCVGAVGAILAAACVVPDICVHLFDHFRAGRHDEAKQLQARLTPLAKLVTTVHGVPGLKAAMDLAGFVGGAPRRPLAPAPPDAVEQIRTALGALRASVGAGR